MKSLFFFYSTAPPALFIFNFILRQGLSRLFSPVRASYPFDSASCKTGATITVLYNTGAFNAYTLLSKTMELCHQFAWHPCTRTMLIFLELLPFKEICCRNKHHPFLTRTQIHPSDLRSKVNYSETPSALSHMPLASHTQQQ